MHSYREWCNKLWNAVRFAMIKLGDHYTPPATVVVCSMLPVCIWILSVLNKTVGKTVSSLEAYNFSEAASSIHSWWKSNLCKVFIEAIKPYFNDSQEFESARGASRDTLWLCLDTGLRLLHPFMPYVTEELWQRLPQPKEACRKDSIMISKYPSVVQVNTLFQENLGVNQRIRLPVTIFRRTVVPYHVKLKGSHCRFNIWKRVQKS